MADVLIVDDHAASREIARATLEHGGHEVIQASDGHQALALARSSHPGLVLTDLLMPGMDGYQFVRELRSSPDMAGLPVLFYTANYLEDEAHPLAVAFGVSKILSKDASPQELLEAVAEALDLQVPVRARGSSDFDAQHGAAVCAKLLEKTAALEESQARFAAVAEALSTGIVVADLSGLATYVSPRLSRMTQISAAGLLGQGWLRCLSRDQRQALCVASPERLPASLNGQRPHEHLTLFHGQERRLSVLIRPVRNDRVVTGFVAMIDDITGVVAADERLRSGAGGG